MGRKGQKRTQRAQCGKGVVNSRTRIGGRGGQASTHYSSSSSRGKLHVVSSSRRQIGRPRRIDIDLSAVSRAMVSIDQSRVSPADQPKQANRKDRKPTREQRKPKNQKPRTNPEKRKVKNRILTPKEQPERAAADFALDEVEPLVRGLLVHAQRHRDVRGLAERGVLRRVVALTEVVHAVARRGESGGRGATSAREERGEERHTPACHGDDVFQEQGTYKYRMTTCMDVGGS